MTPAELLASLKRGTVDALARAGGLVDERAREAQKIAREERRKGWEDLAQLQSKYEAGAWQPEGPGTMAEQAGYRLRNDPFMNRFAFALGTNDIAGKAAGALKSAMPDQSWRGHHRPMTDAGGAARLDDLTKAFPEDIYGPNALQYYGSGDARERSVLRTLAALRNKPDAEVTIYRGVPDKDMGINPGDWVTLSPEVAKDYGHVVALKVPAKDVTAWGDSLLEFGYFPKASDPGPY